MTGDGGTVASEFSAGILLSRVRALPPAPWADGRPESLRSPCCWTMERQQNPDCVHCSVLPHHRVSCDQLIQDFRESVQEAKANPGLSKQGTAGIYGMMAAIPDTVIVEDFIKEFFSEVYKIQ
ncbi:sphingosine-1-phosphate lyase-like [Plakobranchus ocellatus]|uniref:Sphingosine-1-phosphate lyase-like n=1 Tax=Plakobranchus ocellatus TaxID=259542 RepID=A0AAV4AZ91_9GAST|nr:sphingosine-1-phosphate lyase-like [Plakobranchus ocellatus]